MISGLMNQLETEAYKLGFNRIGVVPAVPGKRLDAYLRWITNQQHGEMGYMARPDRVARRQDLNQILPGVQSIICVGLDYYPGKLPPSIANDPGRGRISNYAWGADYHEVMTPHLQQLADWLTHEAKKQGEQASSRVYVDTGAILERDHGETAVLGFTGKNTMLIHPRHGSYFFLGEILTTLPLAKVVRTQMNADERSLLLSSLVAPRVSSVSCGSCHRCLDACPTRAFPRPYVLDARRCISYLTIELREWIPTELRPLMGNWVYGCDVCQEVCPFNRFAGKGETQIDVNERFFDRVAPPLPELLALDEATFSQRFAHSPIRRIKRERLVRNACVAAGNWGSQTAVPVLITLLSDPSSLIRGHAAWALHQIGGEATKTAVLQALATETHETVRRELAGEN